MRRLAVCIFFLSIVMIGASATESAPTLATVPALDEYCLAAQRLVTRTDHPVELVVHEDFQAFVKSKAVIEGPQIQQYNWQDNGHVVGISCKLKSADHLNLTFGDGTAGPDGLCQDMNQAVYQLVAESITTPAYAAVVFDDQENMMNEEQPGMTGPDWLMPYTATYLDDTGKLHIRAKAFQVNFSDPRFVKAPARFRGVHYCHLIAPDYMRGLLAGDAKPGIVIGREVDTSGQKSAVELEK